MDLNSETWFLDIWFWFSFFFLLPTDSMTEERRTLEAAIKYVPLSHLHFSRASGFVVQWESRPTHLWYIIHYSLANNVGICRYRLHRKLLIEKVIQALDIYQERILFWSWNFQIFQENETVLFGCNAPKSPLFW